MRFLVSLILIALLSYVLCLFLPWWSIAIAAFVVAALIPQKGFLSFVSGFASLFLLWGVMALFISNGNHDILANRISTLIFKVDNPFLLILLTAFVGALVAGIAALAGSYTHRKIR
ncbi:MAG: hypothetical protein J0H55_12355 [Chitinophagaceae bacterium]|nr:hypothetical protein [Chitinophagaceae bacterium]